MIVKPSITWLTADSDPLLVNDTNVVLKAMADNVAIYDKPDPDLPVIQTALDNFSDGIAATLNGGQAATIQKNNLRLILTSLLRQEALYVQKACKGSMDNLILSGFPPQKSGRTPIGTLPQPQGATLTHGTLRSQLVANINPVFGASSYTYRLTPNTPGGVPVIVQNTASNNTFDNLAAGVNYTLEVNALGAAGLSDWSNPAGMIAD